MRSNRTTCTNSSAIVKGILLASMGLAVSTGTAAGPARADSQSQAGELVSLSVQGQNEQSLRLHAPHATHSLADIVGSQAPYKVLLRNKVIVRTQGAANIRRLIAEIPSDLGVVILEGQIGTTIDAWELTTTDVRSAIAVAELLSADETVRYASVDSGRVTDSAALAQWARTDLLKAGSGPVSSTRRAVMAPGISTAGTTSEPAGVSDPSLSSFWHLTNTLPIIFSGFDNNVTQAIYDTMGFTGLGVTVGLSRPSNREHLDFNHSDIDANYDPVLSMPVDVNLFPPDRGMTAQAGVIAGERDNGIGGHGVAPNAKIATMSTGTALLLGQMLDYEKNNIDIKVIPSPGLNEFTTMNFAASYNETAVNDFVNDFFLNSLRFGRDRKGSILIFSGGFSADFNQPPVMPFYPDPYDGGGFDDIIAGNVFNNVDDETAPDSGVSPVLNVFASGPTYIRAQTYMYPFASDRRTLLINSVAEDGFADINQAIGPSVFASVYTGTSNVASFFDNPLPNPPHPRGLVTSIPGSLTGEVPDRTTDWLGTADQFTDTTTANGGSAAITGGIVALMLEANPSLTVRDIQHIFFESIYDSARSPAVRFPEFDASLAYISPFAGTGQTSTYSFWQLNSALHTLPDESVASIRHSDQYGFGLIDAELAVSKAADWPGTPSLILLDTGLVDADSGNNGNQETRVPLSIPDAEFLEFDETSTLLIDGARRGDINQINVCVRNNIVIESIVVELSVEGAGFNDIYTTLNSPWGTSSNLSYPTTRNAPGTSFDNNLNDDDRDNVYAVGTLGTTEMALIRHEFTTFKHWGELSGGTWRLNFYDFGADTENADGTAATDTEPAIPNVHDLGVFGLPGSSYRDEKEVVSFRIKIYGYDSGEDPFLGCDPFATSCPGDLNADGVINSADVLLFISWYQSADIRADMNRNGIVDFLDIGSYLAIFQPGFCTVGNRPPFIGGRPRPNTSGNTDSNPSTRPI